MSEVFNECPFPLVCADLEEKGLLSITFASEEEWEPFTQNIINQIDQIQLCQKKKGLDCVLNPPALMELLEYLRAI